MGDGSGLLDSNVGQQRTNVLPLKQPILCKYSLTNSCVKNRKFCTATYCFWLNTVKNRCLLKGKTSKCYFYSEFLFFVKHENCGFSLTSQTCDVVSSICAANRLSLKFS